MRLTALSDIVDANEDDIDSTYGNLIPGPPPVVTIGHVRARHDPENALLACDTSSPKRGSAPRDVAPLLYNRGAQ